MTPPVIASTVEKGFLTRNWPNNNRTGGQIARVRQLLDESFALALSQSKHRASLLD